MQKPTSLQGTTAAAIQRNALAALVLRQLQLHGAAAGKALLRLAGRLVHAAWLHRMLLPRLAFKLARQLATTRFGRALLAAATSLLCVQLHFSPTSCSGLEAGSSDCTAAGSSSRNCNGSTSSSSGTIGSSSGSCQGPRTAVQGRLGVDLKLLWGAFR